METLNYVEDVDTFAEKVEKQINEYQYEIKRLLNENDDIKKTYNLQIQNLTLQLQNSRSENQNIVQKQLQDLEKKHLNEIRQLKDLQSTNMRGELENEIEKLKENHKLEIESLRKDYERLIQEKTEQIRREADRRIEELRQQYENDLDRSTSPDSTISYDLGQKLKEQVKLTQELDSRLIGTIKTNGSNRKSSQNHSVSDSPVNGKLKQLLDKVETEGVLLLSLSELLQLKAHLNQKAMAGNPNAMNKILSAAFENEKDQLLKQIYQLRELIAKINDKDANASKDPRGDLIKCVANVFKEEQEAALAELRTYVTSNAHLDENKATFLENKIKAQEAFIEKSMNALMNADRQSLLNELKHVKEENVKLQDELRRLQDEERQFKRDLQLMEYNKDAENIKANDLKQGLNAEKTKNLELMEKLNQERKKANAMQEQLCDLKDEVARMKDNVVSENKNYKTICKELDAEKARSDELKNYIEHLKSKYRELEENQNEKSRSSARRYANENQEIAHLRKLNNDLEQRFVELQRHANELEHLLVEERAKRDSYLKEINERVKENDYDKRNIKHKFDQIQSTLKQQERDILLTKRLYKDNESENKEDYHKQQINNFKLVNERKSYQANGQVLYGDLERIRQALELVAVKHKNEIESSNLRHDPSSIAIKECLDEIIDELNNLPIKTHPLQQNGLNGTSNGIQDKLLKQNHDLIDAIKKLNEEKINLRNTIIKLEEEIWQNKRNNKNDHGTLSDQDKEKFKKLYYKYLRAESFRKSLVYQKRFLLIMLSGYEDTEREILAQLKLETKTSSHQIMFKNDHVNNNNNNNNNYYQQTNSLVNGNYSKNSSFYSNKFLIHKAKSRFRIAALSIIAIYRIKFLIKKHSHVLTKIDSNRQISS